MKKQLFFALLVLCVQALFAKGITEDDIPLSQETADIQRQADQILEQAIV